MSNRSLIADHASKTYFVIGKWPIFGPGASHKFMVGKNPDGDGDVLELSDTIAVQKELAYWNCTDVRECAVALWEFSNNKTVILLNEEHDDYWRVKETYTKAGQLT